MFDAETLKGLSIQLILTIEFAKFTFIFAIGYILGYIDRKTRQH